MFYIKQIIQKIKFYKMDTKILIGIGILGIMCVVLMSGCITEKEEEFVCNPPYIKVAGKCCLDQNNNGICDKDESECTTDSDCPEGKICKDEKCIEKPPECTSDRDCPEGKICKDEKCVEKPPEDRGEVEKWCLSQPSITIREKSVTITSTNDVKKYKDRWMCHNRYALDGIGVDLYWTKNEEEVYKVLTYPEGTKIEINLKEMEKKYAVCTNIDDLSKKNTCYTKLAVDEGDFSICYKVHIDEIDQCYKEIAVSGEHPSICGKIENTDIKDDCHKEVAVSREDPSICSKIEDKPTWGWYHGRSTETNIKREECYKDIAVSKGDPSICDKIKIDGMRDDCYKDVAISKEDPSICSKIKNDGKIADCYTDIAISKEDPSICDKLKIESKGRADCYTGVALLKEDPSICSNIKVDGRRDNCYEEVAISKKDPSACDKIENEGKRSSCYKSTGG